MELHAGGRFETANGIPPRRRVATGYAEAPPFCVVRPAPAAAAQLLDGGMRFVQQRIEQIRFVRVDGFERFGKLDGAGPQVWRPHNIPRALRSARTSWLRYSPMLLSV